EGEGGGEPHVHGTTRRGDRFRAAWYARVDGGDHGRKEASPKRSRRTAFVPRLLVRTALAGVVPACALVGASGAAGCSSDSSGGPTDTGFLGVAAVAYPAYETGVHDGGGDGTSDAPSDGSDGGADTTPDVFGVAAVAYPAYETGAG